MYIETRFYDDGTKKTRKHKTRPSPGVSKNYDTSRNKYDTIEDWLEGLKGLKADYIVPLVMDLDAGNWVDISDYC